MIRPILLLSAFALAAPALAEVPAAAPVAAQAPAQTYDSRFILLEGGRNFRDLGGLRTTDGHAVKPGLFYRGGPLGSLTEKGRADFAKLHVTRIVDLRTTEERSHDAYSQKDVWGQAYWTRDYGMSMGNMGAMFSDPSKLTAENMRNMMVTAYRTMPKEQVPAYRELFASLVAGQGPVVVNCTAGKDRTGIGTALVLTALGVPYEAVRADYLLSNGAPGMNTLGAAISPGLARLPADVTAPLIGVDGAYLDATFAQLKQDYGSVEGFMQTQLGVGPKEIAAMRARMLQ
ncbi:tyrosine-protein phosphatase [Novosphingobium sp. G106]|uniref:tyrosine-protein phosphatase n=1 Tax=Novosphingobium sp. G106 TaxID=2849500 RepID=UPI001C2DAAFE|nr:tyrosine-protein phosphatase [Novosphingobium sp. G106]MBV1686570.1 tyrosine-protein phosphatase [Novosphingobium sp. G106]